MESRTQRGGMKQGGSGAAAVPGRYQRAKGCMHSTELPSEQSSAATRGAGKQHRKPRGQKARSAARREDFGHGKNPNWAQSSTRGTQLGTEVGVVSPSAPTVPDSGQTELSLCGLFNESLRWDGILEYPAAEEERLRTYRLNRRKRYELYLQQQHPTEGTPIAQPGLRAPITHSNAAVVFQGSKQLLDTERAQGLSTETSQRALWFSTDCTKAFAEVQTQLKVSAM